MRARPTVFPYIYPGIPLQDAQIPVSTPGLFQGLDHKRSIGPRATEATPGVGRNQAEPGGPKKTQCLIWALRSMWRQGPPRGHMKSMAGMVRGATLPWTGEIILSRPCILSRKCPPPPSNLQCCMSSNCSPCKHKTVYATSCQH